MSKSRSDLNGYGFAKRVKALEETPALEAAPDVDAWDVLTVGFCKVLLAMLDPSGFTRIGGGTLAKMVSTTGSLGMGLPMDLLGV